MLSTATGLSDSDRRYLQTIRRSGEDISRIVEHLRDFYRRRPEAEQLRLVNVNEEIDEVIELTRPRWRDLPQRNGISVQVQTDLQADLPQLRSDASELREALINLIFNAVDALPEGGTITLATRLDHRFPADQSQAPRQRVLIEVRDNGMGMDEQTRQRCLEPFYSTKVAHGGTGLGLAMVYGMIQRYEGTIEIESTPGAGTCIRLGFPLRVEEVLADLATGTPIPLPNRSLRILCIDDEPHVRLLLRDCLTNLGHRVSIAPGGQEGVAMFNAALQTQEAYETVITDLGMPGFDGNQVARSIKASSPATPIVMMTGWEATLRETGDMPAEVSALIGKPARAADLNHLLLQLATSSPETQPPGLLAAVA